MSTPKTGTRRIIKQSESTWKWEMSGELLTPSGSNRYPGVSSIPAQLPTGTVVYENVPAERALIDDLLNEHEYAKRTWDSYEAVLHQVTHVSDPADAAWSIDQIDRTRRYVDTRPPAEEKLADLARYVLGEVESGKHLLHQGTTNDQYIGGPGVPLGLGRVVLDSRCNGVLLAPIGPSAPKTATAGRLIEELVWIASLIRSKNGRKADTALSFASSIANALKDHSRLVYYSTLLAFVAHVQRRLSAPLAPAETVDVFWPAILQLIDDPRALGMPWDRLRGDSAK